MSSDFNISGSHASVSSASGQADVAEQRVKAFQDMLTEAVEDNDIDTFERMVFDPNVSWPKNFDLAFTNDRGQTLLHIAAKCGSDDVLKATVEMFPDAAEFLDVVDDDGFSALMYIAASDTDKPDLVKTMIDAGASVNVKTEFFASSDGYPDGYLKELSALTGALETGNVETVAVLVKAGANTAGALRNAANALNKPALDLLVSLDADVGVAYEDAFTHKEKRAICVLAYRLLDREALFEPLSPSSKQESPSERVLFLLRQEGNGRAALIDAAQRGDLNDMKALLDHGVDGISLLVDTVLTQPKIARSLMAAGVSSSAGMVGAVMSKDDEAALMLHFMFGGSLIGALTEAAESGDMNAVNAMIAYGADVTQALAHAAQNGKVHAAAVLAEIQRADTMADKA